MKERVLIDFGKCPYVTAQKLLQGKWSILILHYLTDFEPIRFSDLLKKMPEMTHATLSVQLKGLESQGLIKREAYPEVPPRVEYSLTELGHSFRPVLDEIGRWGGGYMEYVREHPEACR